MSPTDPEDPRREPGQTSSSHEPIGDDTAPLQPQSPTQQQPRPQPQPSIFRYSDQQPGQQAQPGRHGYGQQAGYGQAAGYGQHAGAAPTQAYPTYRPEHGAWAAPTAASAATEPHEHRSGSPRRWTAGVLAGALLLGGAAGVVGAAGYDALNGDGGTTTVTRSALSPSTASKASTGAQGSVEQVAQSVLPSVVMITVRGPQGEGSGSGIVISSDGEILTNNHVVEAAGGGSGSMQVSFNDGSTAPATVVGTDPVTDIAVIKAKGVSGLTPATFGDSDQLAVGQQVVAVGSPFGLEATVTSGIVSALGRPVSVSESETDSSADTTYPAIQTDAAINPGNSGGPLLNMSGQVVGINSSIRTSSSSSMFGGQGGSIGLGFAIPVSEIAPIVQQLRQGETATHARLGVTVSDDVSKTGLVDGAKVRSVESGSAGDDAGLQAGDVITKVDDTLVSGSSSLVATIRGYRPGDTVTLTVLRDGGTQQVPATLGSDATSS